MTKSISRTLIVGLGGTGQTVIRDIKKRLLCTYGEIPNLVKFLVFDTDDYLEPQRTPFKYCHEGETYEDYKYCIQRNELFLLRNPGVEALSRDPVCSEKLDLDLLREVSARFRDAGAGGYRILGRACFLNSSQDIIQMLSIAIRDLRDAMLPAYDIARGYNVVNNGNIRVFVVASLAGGTGSSAIMDISRMLQIAGINVHYNNDAALDKIFGVFFMPGFFEGKPNTAANIRINAYTALSELDYTMGLADPTRYALGCRELEDDRQDYFGYPDNGKRVIYDNVFLIDSHTSKGHTHSIADASIDVASFIAGSIDADTNTIISSYLNSNHKTYSVDGKHQNYSGLGYCEIRFCRQELVRYLLNKKLIGVLEQFKAGDNGVSVNQIAQSFIDVNKLNEGVMQNSEGEDTRSQLNELTDAIINVHDWQFTCIPMRSVETGRDAADHIENAKTEYLCHIGAEAQEAVQAFGQRKQELFQSLRTFLDERMTEKGFGRFPDLVKCLKTMLTEMKSGLEDELNQNATLFDRIDRGELRQLKYNIADNSSRSFMGIGDKTEKQKCFMASYCNKVRFDAGNQTSPTLGWLKVDSTRKNEAVAVYEEMIAILDSYYKEETVETVNDMRVFITGAFLNVVALYNGLLERLIKENNCYMPSKAAKNETVFADAYFKEYFEQNEANLTMQTEHELEQYIGQLFTDQPFVYEEKLVEMRQTLLCILPSNGIIRKIQECRMSIDELIIHCFGSYGAIKDCNDIQANPQLQLLGQVNYLFDTLCRYVNFTGQGLEPSKNVVVGVYDTQNCIFSPLNGYQAVIDDNNYYNYSYINLGDPDRIAFMLTETGIPAHKLVGVEDWAKEFIQKRQYIYSFSDKRLEDIDMIPGMYEEAEIAWAYGWLFGLITHPINKKGLRVKPSYGLVQNKALTIEENGDYRYFEITLPSDIYYCHQKFIKGDIALSKDIYDQAMTLLMQDQVGNAEKIMEWVNEGKMWSPEVRGKQRTSMTSDELNVIQNEVKYLAMRFKMLGLSLNEFGQVVRV